MKDFAMRVFDWSHERMYGPSNLRNAPDHTLPGDVRIREWEAARDRYGPNSIVFADRCARWANVRFSQARRALDAWWENTIWSSAKALTARYVLQTLGTEVGRNGIGPDIWVNAAQEKVQMTATLPVVVFSDGRFNNEFVRARQLGWELWHIERPDARISGGVPGHESEIDMFGPVLQRLRTRHYLNNQTLQHLEAVARQWTAE